MRWDDGRFGWRLSSPGERGTGQMKPFFVSHAALLRASASCKWSQAVR